MANYQVYRIGKGGRFVGVHEVVAASDTDAIVQAHQLFDGVTWKFGAEVKRSGIYRLFNPRLKLRRAQQARSIQISLMLVNAPRAN